MAAHFPRISIFERCVRADEPKNDHSHLFALDGSPIHESDFVFFSGGASCFNSLLITVDELSFFILCRNV